MRKEFQLSKIVHPYKLAFSSGDRFLIALGVGVGGETTIEVLDWVQQELIMTKVFSKEHIFDLVPNAYDPREFVVSGRSLIQRLKIQGGGLNVTQSVELQDLVVTALSYYYYLLGEEVDYDLVLGSQNGEIGLVTFGKYQTIHEKAHQGQVNVLKITDLFDGVIVIISAGEDQLIKFWNAKLQFMNVIDLSQCSFFTNDLNNHSAHSLDLFACKGPSNQNLSLTALTTSGPRTKTLLISTRNNELLEVKVLTEYQKIIEKAEGNENLPLKELSLEPISQPSKKNLIIENFNFQNQTLIFRYNASQSEESIFITVLCDSLGLLVTCLEEQVFFWDLKSRETVYTFQNQSKVQQACLIAENRLLLLLDFNKILNVYKIALKENMKQAQGFYIKNIELVYSHQFTLKSEIFKFVFFGGLGNILYTIGNLEQCKKHNEQLLQKFKLVIEEEKISLQKNFEFQADKIIFSKNNLNFQKKQDSTLEIISVEKGECEEELFFNIHDKDNNKKQTNYFIYNIPKNKFKELEKKELLNNFPFQASEINVYLEQTSNKSLSQGQQQKPVARTLKINCRIVLSGSAIYGTEEGFLLLAKRQSQLKTEGAKLYQQMKVLASQGGPISSILYSPSKNIVLAISNKLRSICQYKIVHIPCNWEYNYFLHPLSPQKKVFCEDRSLEEFKDYLSKMVDQRNELLNLKNKSKQQGSLQLKIYKALGRKASFSLNSMFTSGSKVLYLLGGLVCQLDLVGFNKKRRLESQLHQEFLMLDQQMNESFNCPEISVFCLDSFKTRLCLGTLERQSHLYFWDIQSLQFFDKVALPGASKVQHICFSVNSKHLACVALDERHFQTVYFICIQHVPTILATASFQFGACDRIKGISADPVHFYRFITFGTQHLTKWCYGSGMLHHEELPIERTQRLNIHGSTDTPDFMVYQKDKSKLSMYYKFNR